MDNLERKRMVDLFLNHVKKEIEITLNRGVQVDYSYNTENYYIDGDVNMIFDDGHPFCFNYHLQTVIRTLIEYDDLDKALNLISKSLQIYIETRDSFVYDYGKYKYKLCTKLIDPELSPEFKVFGREFSVTCLRDESPFFFL